MQAPGGNCQVEKVSVRGRRQKGRRKGQVREVRPRGQTPPGHWLSFRKNKNGEPSSGSSAALLRINLGRQRESRKTERQTPVQHTGRKRWCQNQVGEVRAVSDLDLNFESGGNRISDRETGTTWAPRLPPGQLEDGPQAGRQETPLEGWVDRE